MEIHIGRDSQQVGVFSVDELVAAVKSGQILLTDLAWSDGEPDWKILSEFAASRGIELAANASPLTAPPQIPTSNVSAERRSSSLELPAELRTIPGSEGRIQAKLLVGTVVGALLRTESRLVVTGHRTVAFNPIGAAVRGIEKKEAVNCDIQEFFIKPIDGGKQFAVSVEAQGFRVADGHQVTAVVVGNDEIGERPIAVLNNATGEQAGVLQDFSDLKKSKEKLAGVSALSILVISALIGGYMKSWIMFGIALVALGFLEHKFVGAISNATKAEELLNNLATHSAQCLDYAEKQQAA